VASCILNHCSFSIKDGRALKLHTVFLAEWGTLHFLLRYPPSYPFSCRSPLARLVTHGLGMWQKSSAWLSQTAFALALTWSFMISKPYSPLPYACTTFCSIGEKANKCLLLLIPDPAHSRFLSYTVLLLLLPTSMLSILKWLGCLLAVLIDQIWSPNKT
jgi:hypothetical protein